jgi:hypothetical protein
MILEMDVLNQEQQLQFLNDNFPMSQKQNELLASIYGSILMEARIENSKLSTFFSTRMALEAASLINDGFTLQEAAEISIFPFYSDEGGLQSERTYVKQLVQKFIPDATLPDNIFED